MIDQLRRFVNPIHNKIASLIALGVVKQVYKSSEAQRLLMDMLAGESRDQVKHHLPYGFTQHPHPGAEGITLFMNGDKSEGITILVGDERYHMQVEQGEVAIYDDLKQSVHLMRDKIRLKTDQKVLVDAPESEFTGNVVIKKTLTVDKDATLKASASIGKRMDVVAGASIGGVEFSTHRHNNTQPGDGFSGDVSG